MPDLNELSHVRHFEHTVIFPQISVAFSTCLFVFSVMSRRLFVCVTNIGLRQFCPIVYPVNGRIARHRRRFPRLPRYCVFATAKPTIIASAKLTAFFHFGHPCAIKNQNPLDSARASIEAAHIVIRSPSRFWLSTGRKKPQAGVFGGKRPEQYC